jgi:CHAT domain-containing protein
MSSRLLFLGIALASQAFCNDHLPLPADKAAIWADYEQRFEQQYSLPLFSIQQQLHTNHSPVLHFFIDGPTIRLYLIFKEDILIQTIDASPQIERDINVLIQSIKQWPASHQPEQLFTYQQKAYHLYHMLLEPIAALLPPKVRIIPDGFLSKLPFEALLYKAASHRDMPLSAYPFLVKKHQISYINAWQLAAALPEAYVPPQKNRILAYAPVFAASTSKTEASGLRPLYHNRQEVEAISQFFPTDIRWGESATIDNFLQEAPKYRILHLATHTQWAALHQGAQQLAFTSKLDGSDRHLLVDSILLSQKLQAEMVVLSACESGTGQASHRKNQLTLTAAFAQTGIRSLITTLWPIDDKATADFMMTFYAQLQEGKAKDAALRHAKLRFIEHQAAYYAHPFYWANYVIYGETKPIKYCEKIPQPLRYVLIVILGGGVLMVCWQKDARLF